MNNIREITEKILAIRNPNEAYINLGIVTHKENIPLEEWERIVELYMEKYNVTHDEMAFTPDGDRVVDLDMFLSWGQD